MDKFSLYDFMSFFMPGVLACYISLHFIPTEWLNFKEFTDFISGLIFTLIAIIVGLINHTITNYLIFKKEIKWLSFLVRKPIDQIAIDNVKYIKTNYENIMRDYNTNRLTGVEMFSEAYFFLEYQDKISAVKSFQSMHFFLRNIITIQLVFLPFLIGFLFAGYHTKVTITLLVITIISFPFILWSSNFFRKKMVERVFNTFYVAMKYK